MYIKIESRDIIFVVEVMDINFDVIAFTSKYFYLKKAKKSEFC